MIIIGSKWRVLLVIAFPAAVLCALMLMQRPSTVAASNGIADLTEDSSSTESGRGASEVAADKAATSSSSPVDQSNQ